MNLAFPKPTKKRKKTRPGNSPEYLLKLRLCQSVVSGRTGCEVHHLKQTGERGMGMRSPDKYGLPLLHDEHMELESVGSKNELQWFRDHGVPNPLKLAERLWEARNSLEDMRLVIMKYRGKE